MDFGAIDMMNASLGAEDLIWLGSGAATELSVKPGDIVTVACTSIGVLRNTGRVAS